MSYLDHTSVRFNRLIAVKRVPGKSRWLFRCDCLSLKEIRIDHVIAGKIRSCGCLSLDPIVIENKRKRATKHGFHNHPLYPTWVSMNARCSKTTHEQFKDYGGRGISICEDWKGIEGFQQFVRDMGSRPKGMTLDREDNNGNYNKENCRWADRIIQNNNGSRNRFITHDGQTLTIFQWARKMGIEPRTLWHRVNVGWDIGRALSKGSTCSTVVAT